MSTSLVVKPTRAHRALGVALSLIAFVALSFLAVIVLIGAKASGWRTPGATALLLSGILIFLFGTAWLFYRFAFTKPARLGKRGLWALSAIFLLCAIGQIAIGFVTNWQSIKQAIAASVLAVAAFMLARSGRDA